MRRNFRLALSLVLGAALLPAAAFAKGHDRQDDRSHWSDKDKKDKSEKHADGHDRDDFRRDRARDRGWDRERDARWHREHDHDRDDRIARVRDHERQEREEREARDRRWREDQHQENLRREREWQRQREWERQHNRMTAERGPNHTPAGWIQGKKTGWKGCDVPPGQAKPSECQAVAPVQPVPPQARVERRDNDHDRDDVARTARVRDPNVRPQPPMSERH